MNLIFFSFYLTQIHSLRNTKQSLNHINLYKKKNRINSKASRGKAYVKKPFIKLDIDYCTELAKEDFMDFRNDVQSKIDQVILHIDDITTKVIEEKDINEKDI